MDFSLAYAVFSARHASDGPTHRPSPMPYPFFLLRSSSSPLHQISRVPFSPPPNRGRKRRRPPQLASLLQQLHRVARRVLHRSTRVTVAAQTAPPRARGSAAVERLSPAPGVVARRSHGGLELGAARKLHWQRPKHPVAVVAAYAAVLQWSGRRRLPVGRCSACAAARSSVLQRCVAGGCNGASPAKPRAVKQRPALQWSFTGEPGATLQRVVRCCSSAGAAMELSRSYNGTSSEQWSSAGVGAPPGLQWSSAGVAMEPPELQ